MKKKVVYLHPEEAQGIVNILAEIPIKYTSAVTPVIQLLNTRAEALVEADIPDDEPEKKAARKPKPPKK